MALFNSGFNKTQIFIGLAEFDVLQLKVFEAVWEPSRRRSTLSGERLVSYIEIQP